MNDDGLRIVPMSGEQIAACAAIVAASPLLREAYGLDAERVAGLLGDALGDPAGRVELAVALRRGRPVGLSWFVVRGAFDRSGYLRLIAVEPTLQRAGTGRALLEALEGRHLGRGGIALLVASENHGARRFYQQLGYAEVGELRDYVAPGRHERLMYKGPAAAGTP